MEDKAPAYMTADDYSALWDDRKKAEQWCQKQLEAAESSLATSLAIMNEANSQSMGPVVDIARAKVASWKNCLENVRDGMLPPTFVIGTADDFRKVAAGQPTDLPGPEFEYQHATDLAVAEGNAVLLSRCRSHLAWANELFDHLVGEGVDPKMLRAFGDFLYSAGRYRERIAVEPFEADVIVGKRHRREQGNKRRKHVPDEVLNRMDDLMRGGAKKTPASARVLAEFPHLDISARTIRDAWTESRGK